MAIENTEKETERLVRIYEDAEKKIARAIKKLKPGKTYTQTRKELMSELKRVQDELLKESQKWSKSIVETNYKQGSEYIVDQISSYKENDEINASFSSVDKESVDALLTQNLNSFGETMQGINKAGEKVLTDFRKQKIQDDLASDLAAGISGRKSQQNILEQLEQTGFKSLTDRGGRAWTLPQYSRMLGRTMTMKARNDGAKARILQNGGQWAKISRHGDPARPDICTPYEGKIVDLLDPDIPLPPYHPNCAHTIQYVDPVELEDMPGGATNNKEAEDFAKRKLSQKADYDGLETSTSNLINQTVSKEINTMGLPKLKEIKSTTLPDGVISQFRAKNGLGEKINTLYLNKSLLAKNAEAAKLMRAEGSKWLRADQKRAAIKNFEQLISSLNGQTKVLKPDSETLLDLYEQIKSFKEQIDALRNLSNRPFYQLGEDDLIPSAIRHEIGHYVAEENPDAFKEAKELFDKLNLKKISEYAKMSPEEMFAEAYNAWSVGDYNVLPPELVQLFNKLLS